MVNGAEVVCPASIVIETGTVASPASLLASITVSSPVVSVLRITVAVVAPPFSLMAASTIVTVSPAISSPSTLHVDRIRAVGMHGRTGRHGHGYGQREP